LEFGAWYFFGVWILVFGDSAASAVDDPLSPEESLKHFQTEPGLRVELVAAEPMVVDPVAIAWDERGRMFVVENRGYPTGPAASQPPLGQIVLLEDTNRDGRYDNRTVYTDGLTFPNGVQPWKGGVYVTCAPYLYYFKDTDGDGKADVKEIVFEGFQDLSTTQLRVSHPMLAMDNWIYLTSGLTAAKVTAPAWGKLSTQPAPVELRRVDARFRPGTTELEPASGTAQFGQTFDAFGRRFICSNRNHVQHVVMDQRYLQRNPHLSFSQVVEDIPDHGAACRLYPISANIVTAAYHGGYVTSACGLTIYNGTALPDEYRGNSFVCEPAANLVHRDVLVPDGVTFTAKRAYPTNEFLASPDNWFRPVNLSVGPDGALYVCDMYRKTIEHPEYLPEATRKATDFDSGKGMGRIYRVVADFGKAKAARKSSVFSVQNRREKVTVKQLCAELENPNEWARITAQRLLLERSDAAATPELRKLARISKPPESRLHALYLLQGLDALTTEDIWKALNDPHEVVRRRGVAFAEPLLALVPPFVTHVMDLADDPDHGVRFQSALALTASADSRAISALVRILSRNVEDKWTRAAVLGAITQREGEFFRAWLPVAPTQSSMALTELMSDLGRILALSQKQNQLAPLLRELLAANRPTDQMWQLAAVAGFGSGLRARESGTREPSPLVALAESEPQQLRSPLDALLKRASELVFNTERPTAERLAAVNLLAEGTYTTSGDKLERLLAPQHPVELQTAAIRALARMVAPEKLSLFVQRTRWNAYSPSVREIVLSLLTADAKRLPILLSAIEAGNVPAWTINPERRTWLLRHKDSTIRSQAERLFKELMFEDRLKVYEDTKTVLTLNGAGSKGRELFIKHCLSCHTFAGEGHLVGPDLTGIRNQPVEAILLHIVVPEQEIMPTYTAYNVETKSGESYSGLLAAESSGSITLRMAQGFEQQLSRTEIMAMTPSRLSLMPQELEKAMTKQELADLLAFLKGQ